MSFQSPNFSAPPRGEGSHRSGIETSARSLDQLQGREHVSNWATLQRLARKTRLYSACGVPLACNKSKCTVTLLKSGTAAISLANTCHFERGRCAKLFFPASRSSYLVPVAGDLPGSYFAVRHPHIMLEVTPVDAPLDR